MLFKKKCLTSHNQKQGESSEEVAYQLLPVGLGIPEAGGVQPPEEVPTEITTVIPTIADYSSSCNNTITNNNCIVSDITSCSAIPVATSSSDTTKFATSVVVTDNSSSSNAEGTLFSIVNVPTSDTTTTSSLTTTRCFGICNNNEFDKTVVGNLITSPVITKQETFTGSSSSSVTSSYATTTNSDRDVLHNRWTDIPLRRTNPNWQNSNTDEVGINRYITTTPASNINTDDTITQTTTYAVGVSGDNQTDSTLLAPTNIGTSLGIIDTPTPSYTTNKNNYVDILNSTSPGSSTSGSTTLFDSTTTHPNNYFFDADHFFPNLGFNQQQQTQKLPPAFLDLVDVDLQDSKPLLLLDVPPSNHFPPRPSVSGKSCRNNTLYSKPPQSDEQQAREVSYLAQPPPLSHRTDYLINNSGLHSTTVINPNNSPENQYYYSQSQTDPCSSPNADGNTTIARRVYNTTTTATTPTSFAATCSGTNNCHKKYGKKSSCTRTGGGFWIENNVKKNNSNTTNNSGSDSCSGACCCSDSSNSCCCSSSESSPDNDITISRNRRKKTGRCRVGGSGYSPIARKSRLEEDRSRSERSRQRKSGRIEGGREDVSSVLTVGRGGGTDNKSLPKTYAPFGSLGSCSNSSVVGFNIKDSVLNSNNNNNNNRTIIPGISAVDSLSLGRSTNSSSREREAVDDYFHKHCHHSSPQRRRQRNVPKFAASSDDNDVEDDNGDERELLKRRRRRERENDFNEEEEEEEEEEVENPEQQLLISDTGKYRNNNPNPKKADSHYNRWWGSRNNRRWWPVVAGGRGFKKKTKKQDLQEEEEEEEEAQDLELLKNSRPEDPSTGGSGRLGGVTPYTTTTTTSSSVIVAADDDDDDDDPRYPFHRHYYKKQITGGQLGSQQQQQQQECRRHGYYHHHQQQQTHHHHCGHPQGNKICHHHHHQQQQYHKGDSDGEPPDLQNNNRHHHRRHHYHRHHKDHYCRFNIHGRGGGGAYDDEEEDGGGGGGEEDSEAEEEEEESDKSGGRRRKRFRRGQGEAAAAITMESCTQCLKNEFKPENAGLNHDDPSVFVRSQWPLDHRLYVLYRIVVALGFIAWIIADIIDEAEKFYKDRFWIWFIFATNWSFILLTLTTIFEAICSTYYLVATRGLIDKFRYHKENSDQQYFQEMPICLKIQWLLYNLGANTAIVITISYWSFIFFMEHSKFLMTNMSKTKHMLNTVYVVLDIFISATPIRIFHMLFPIMLGSIYAIFNATYFLNDGTILDGRHYAYNVLNWNVPAEAIVTCILCIAQTIFSQIILYHLAALRKWIASKISKPREPIPEHDSEMQSIMSADSTTYLATDSQTEAGPGIIH